MKTRKIMTLAILSLVFLGVLTMLSTIARADTEPNDDFDHAELITAGTHTGSLGAPDEYDYYKIIVGAGQSLSVNVTPASTLAVYLDLYNPDRERVAYDHSTSKGAIVRASWTTNSKQPNYTYYIRLDRYSGSGTYSMQVTLTSQNDANSGGDAGDTLEKPTQIASANATYTGCFLKDDDTDDYYKLTVSAGQTLWVEVTPATGLSVRLTLYNPAKEDKASDSGTKGAVVKADWTTNSQQASYVYYIKVYIGFYGGSGTYSMQVTLTSQNDANSGGDAGDTFEASTQIPSVIATYPGFLKGDDEDDYYKLNVTAGQILKVRVAPAETLGVSLVLYNPLKEEVASDKYGDRGVNATASIEAETTGTYYVRVTIYSGSGTYSMEVSLPMVLTVTATASPETVYSGRTSTIKINVNCAGTPVANATVTLTSDRGGSFSTVTDHNNGTYTATFTAPTVTTSTVCVITATASKSGYISAQGQTQVTVQLRPLAVTAAASPATIYSGGTSTIRVSVTSEGTSITGATVSLTSDKGGTFSAVTDHNNGTYTATFTAPDITAQTTCTITATASKSGYTSGSAQTTVTVQPLVLNIYVKDAEGRPIAGATVVSTAQPSGQTALSGTTDANGLATFTGILKGSYTIKVSKSGYEDNTWTGTVSAGQVTTQTITLATPFPWIYVIIGIVAVVIVVGAVFALKMRKPKT